MLVYEGPTCLMETALQISPKWLSIMGLPVRISGSQPLHSPNFSVSVAYANASKGRTVPSLDHDYRLPLSFGSLIQILAALVVCQCLQIDVLFVSFFSHNFSTCSQKKSVKKVCLYFMEAKHFLSLDFWVKFRESLIEVFCVFLV